MAIKDRTLLKTYFENGDIPDETQFSDLIDSAAILSGDNSSVGNWTINGNVTVNGTVSATILSATRIDLKEYEISGFSVNGGNITVNGGDVVITSVGSLVSGIPNWDTGASKAQENKLDINTIAAVSGGWNSTQTTVNSNSASWAAQFDPTFIAAASGGWNSTQTTVNSNSASWVGGGDLSDVVAASGGWNSTESTVNSNSGSWESHFDPTLIATASGGWNSTETTVNSNSAMWGGLGFYKPTSVINSKLYAVPLNESGTTYVVSADPGGGNVTFVLPNGTINNLGANYTFVKYSSSTMITISADFNHKIDDSSLGGTFYAGSGVGPVSAQLFASCEIHLVLPDTWHVITGRKTWTSTEWV